MSAGRTKTGGGRSSLELIATAVPEVCERAGEWLACVKSDGGGTWLKLCLRGGNCRYEAFEARLSGLMGLSWRAYGSPGGRLLEPDRLCCGKLPGADIGTSSYEGNCLPLEPGRKAPGGMGPCPCVFRRSGGCMP